MEQKLSRWGIGPFITLTSLAYAAAAAAVTYAWPDACVVPVLGHGVVRTLAVILLVLGFPMWLTAAITVMRAYNHDQLVTSGIYGLSRHPLYGAWIVLIGPGLVLLTRSWPLLITPLVAYTVFKLLVHREDEYLERQYGAAYLQYRAQVNELIPIPRFRHRKHAAIG